MILHGDCLKILPTLTENAFNTCVTSPPYFGLRDYGVPSSTWPEITYKALAGSPLIKVPAWSGCLGLEPTIEMFIAHIVHVFREVWRVLRDDGTLWINFGDSYAGSGKGPTGKNGIGNQQKRQGFHSNKVVIPNGLKPKDLIGIPWRVSFALQADGWFLRSDIIWNKPNPMPESVRDRPTKSHEYIFLFSKKQKYYYDHDAIKEEAVGANQSGKNRRSVWSINTKPFKEAHFAVFPSELIEPCILAGAPEGGEVLDPFGGAGTTLKVSLDNGRKCTSIEIGEQYVKIQEKRTGDLLKIPEIEDISDEEFEALLL